MYKSERQFGIELETFLPNEVKGQFNPGTHHRGLEIQGSPRTGAGLPWKAELDGSLVGGSTSTFAVEIVSPPLKGEEGLIDVLAYLDYLNEVQARPNGSCGIHVHVDVSDLSTEQKQEYIRLFKEFETAFFALNGSYAGVRWGSSYCKPSRAWDTHDVQTNVHSFRYQSLNWAKMPRTGTIEFRLYAGKLAEQPEMVITAVMLGVLLADLIRANDLHEVQAIRANCTLPSAKLAMLCNLLGLVHEPEFSKEIYGLVMDQARQADSALV